ncbi:GATA-type domain-containing protein [Balamuthia mandrillaris]
MYDGGHHYSSSHYHYCPPPAHPSMDYHPHSHPHPAHHTNRHPGRAPSVAWESPRRAAAPAPPALPLPAHMFLADHPHHHHRPSRSSSFDESSPRSSVSVPSSSSCMFPGSSSSAESSPRSSTSSGSSSPTLASPVSEKLFHPSAAQLLHCGQSLTRLARKAEDHKEQHRNRAAAEQAEEEEEWVPSWSEADWLLFQECKANLETVFKVFAGLQQKQKKSSKRPKKKARVVPVQLFKDENVNSSNSDGASAQTTQQWEWTVSSNSGNRDKQRKKSKGIASKEPLQERECRHCVQCKSIHTPEWRRGPDGAKNLCNACGLRYRRKRLRVEESRRKLSITNLVN